MHSNAQIYRYRFTDVNTSHTWFLPFLGAPNFIDVILWILFSVADAQKNLEKEDLVWRDTAVHIACLCFFTADLKRVQTFGVDWNQ